MAEPLAATADTEALAALRRKAAERDQLRAAIVTRLGIPTDAPLSAVVSALDQALAEREQPTVPDGCEVVDSPTLAELRRDAEIGRDHHVKGLLADALRQGKIPPAAVPSWRTLFAADPHSAETMLRMVKPNTSRSPRLATPPTATESYTATSSAPDPAARPWRLTALGG